MMVHKISFAAFCACALASGAGSSPGKATASVPWPTIPTQQPAAASTGTVYVYPTSVVKGLTARSASGTASSPLVFNTVGDIYTLDYGADVAGKPTFEIAAVKGNAQIEVKYSESFSGLLFHHGDGPYAFANGLSNTFRVETFNITSVGNLTSFFIQGSQRWQSVRMVKGSGLKIGKAGFVSSVDQTPLASMKGYFASSNSTYSDIWALGPRTQQLACYPPGTQTSTWEITKYGAYIRGQRPASTTKVVNLVNYTLDFETMIDYGGIGWRVDNEIDAIQASGPYFILTSEYPEGSFANIDRSLVPPNTLVLGRGWSLQNQTSLPGYVLQKFPLNVNVTEKTWHKIKTVCPGGGIYTVYFDNRQIAHFNISSFTEGAPNPFIPGGQSKGFSIGPWQDQAAYVRNINVTLGTGQNVYSNPMTSQDVLEEYGVQTNDQYVCSDAGKRDRYSWLGDRLMSSRTIMVSSQQWEYVWGPADQTFSRGATSGQVPANTLFSPLDTQSSLIRTQNVDPLLADYDLDFMQLIYNYWLRSGNDTFLQANWPNMVGATSWAISRSLDEVTQLYGAPYGTNGIPLSSEKGQALGPASTVSLVLGLERMAEMAEYLGYYASAATYRLQATLSRTAIDTLLWNATGGYYSGAIGFPGYDMMDIAQVLLSQIGTPERRAMFLGKLGGLKVSAGYLNGTRFIDTPGIVNPYFESFLLEALAISNETELAQGILDATYAPMVRRDRNYTGAYWEYISPDGVYPGLGLFTAQSHFWGSYPTVFLTEYVLGVRPSAPAYAQFLFAPLPGFMTDWVHGRVPTPSGIIYAAWGYDFNGKIVMDITAPPGTNGTLVPPFPGTYTTGGRSGVSGSVVVTGGSGSVRITQD